MACSVISHLVYEAFYTQSTMHIGRSIRLHRPQSEVREFVRRISMDFSLSVKALGALVRGRQQRLPVSQPSRIPNKAFHVQRRQ